MRGKELKNLTTTAFPNLVLTASGPGELTGWVRPLVEEIRRQEKAWRVSLVLWKTALSTGSERGVQSQLPGLDTVLMLRSNVTALGNGQALSRLRETGTPKALLHLGGDALLSRFLAMRLRCPSILYSEHDGSWRNLGFRKTLLLENGITGPRQATAGPCGRYQVVGDLFVDALAGRPPRSHQHVEDPIGRKVTIGLFPGSRPYQIQYMGPLFLLLCKRIAKKIPDVEFIFAKSEYLPPQTFLRLVTGRFGSLSNQRKTLRLNKETPSHPENVQEPNIPVMSSRDVLARSDMVVMLPGTSTAEAMLMGVPMIVLAPYYRLGSNPAPGVPTSVDAILGMLGKCIKQKILLSIFRRFVFFSHPNLRSGREIVPELRGWIKPSQIVETVSEMARNKGWRERISLDLKELAGPPGAAKRIIEVLEPFMK